MERQLPQSKNIVGCPELQLDWEENDDCRNAQGFYLSPALFAEYMSQVEWRAGEIPGAKGLRMALGRRGIGSLSHFLDQ